MKYLLDCGHMIEYVGEIKGDGGKASPVVILGILI